MGQEGRHTVEGAFIRDVVDEQDAHGTPVVGGSDGAEALLPCRIPDLQLHPLAVQLDGPDLEVDADGRDERRRERVLAEAQQAARLAYARVADQQQLDLSWRHWLSACVVVQCGCVATTATAAAARRGRSGNRAHGAGDGRGARVGVDGQGSHSFVCRPWLRRAGGVRAWVDAGEGVAGGGCVVVGVVVVVVVFFVGERAALWFRGGGAQGGNSWRLLVLAVTGLGGWSLAGERSTLRSCFGRLFTPGWLYPAR